ncbi:MAG: asparagine synthase (glutamine-hydrolyzing), partial [Candidatus Melainabacteria bacterium]|nr:asparagine synthase (glutamine-hydrolyzing) [Candidatus Melainabacteria bacterium]
HRGPDEEGRMIIGPVALGMTRLSIIDLTSGQQPITNEDKTIWLVFNGEIYNFQDLQDRLLARGHKLATKSDTETIVHLYEDYGLDCLQFLEGMFAFALWDQNNQRLFMARDRMGEKPLHWGVFAGQLIFSSEIKGILAHPKATAELNPTALQKYLALEYVPAPHSIFQGIEKLLPAHYMVIENGQIKTQRYWQPKAQFETISEEQATQQLVHLLSQSTKLRLISDVPLGVFLSGGVDSSSIAALASLQCPGKLKTFSIGFADKSFDESEHALAVASHLGTEHMSYCFTPDIALTTMEDLWRVLDEPFADASIVPTYFLSKMTRKTVTVALAGEGGDELFGGYPTYQAHRLAMWWQLLPQTFRQHIVEPAINSLPVNLNNLSFDFKAKRFIKAANDEPVRRHLRWMGSIPVPEQSKLLSPSLICLKQDSELYPELEHLAQSGRDVIDTIMHVDMTTYLPDDLLVKSDRASMAASLEVRLPFLAYPLVEFALSLPSTLKVKGLTTKYLLKKAMASYLPPRTVHRPKKGFGIPVARWLKKEFASTVSELLCERFVARQGIFVWPYIKDLLHEHNEGFCDRRKELWTLLMFQWWWRKFFVNSNT